MNIIEAMADPNLFGQSFAGDSWEPWRAALSAMHGLPLAEDQRDIFKSCTSLTDPQPGGYSEGWFIVGRRGGKSRMLALMAVMMATFTDWSKVLAPGERGVVMVVSQNRQQASVVLRYAMALIEQNRMLNAMVTRVTADTIELSNGAAIEVHACSFRSIRGHTVVAALLDECAYWRTDDSQNPDVEILNALRPAMATVPGAKLVAVGSPYARRGEMWQAFSSYFGKPNPDVLVWQAASRTMNPELPQSVVDQALERDPARAQAEYLARFREEIEQFISVEQVEAATVPGRIELPPVDGVHYFAFVDPAGGSGKDAMTLAISHKNGPSRVLDVVREVKPKFSPEQVVADFCKLLKRYRITTVTGDRYAGEWPRERFRKNGITYRLADRVRSDLYRDLLPLINSGQCQLLDSDRLKNQLTALERRTGRSGRDIIDHGLGGHDDLANSVAGALVSQRGSGEAVFWISVLTEGVPWDAGGLDGGGISGGLGGAGSFEDYLRRG